MIVGIPKEIKPDEYRVSMTPAGVHDLVGSGHKVLVENKAMLRIYLAEEFIFEALTIKILV